MADSRRAAALPPDADLVAALRDGDGSAFAAVLDAWSPGMLRVARAYVADRHTAEDVVQDTWLAVLRGLDRFEGRSSLRTWTYRILVNLAKTRGVRDARTVPWSGLDASDDGAPPGPTVDPALFSGRFSLHPGHWRRPPAAWPPFAARSAAEPSPEEAALAAEVRRRVEEAVAELPERQRVVLVLRDVQGYSSEEVCAVLDVSAGNQRVLLHRARAVVRGRLSEYLTPSEVPR